MLRFEDCCQAAGVGVGEAHFEEQIPKEEVVVVAEVVDILVVDKPWS